MRIRIVLPAWLRTGLLVSALAATALTAHAQNVTDYRNMADPLLLLVREPAVHDELELSKDQRRKLVTLNQRHDGVLLASRNQKPEASRAEIERVFANTRQALQEWLDETQQRRLEQITCRVRGIPCVLDPQVARRLKLSDPQQQRLRSIIETGNQQLDDLRQQLTKAHVSQDEAQRRNTEIQRRQQREVFEELSEIQRRAFLEIVGPSFDLSKLGHVAFRAPELSGTGPWINSTPLKLSALRGKVIVVHFWAFQCINCIRNFPSYRQWQREFADDGLVMIGVHTPETSRERSVDALRDAVRREGLTFPILVDNDQQTWNTWGNAMWPSVYLVDKQGRVRYWWYGELNWQGARGQQIMGDKIRQLLAE